MEADQREVVVRTASALRVEAEARGDEGVADEPDNGCGTASAPPSNFAAIPFGGGDRLIESGPFACSPVVGDSMASPKSTSGRQDIAQPADATCAALPLKCSGHDEEQGGGNESQHSEMTAQERLRMAQELTQDFLAYEEADTTGGLEEPGATSAQSADTVDKNGTEDQHDVEGADNDAENFEMVKELTEVYLASEDNDLAGDSTHEDTLSLVTKRPVETENDAMQDAMLLDCRMKEEVAKRSDPAPLKNNGLEKNVDHETEGSEIGKLDKDENEDQEMQEREVEKLDKNENEDHEMEESEDDKLDKNELDQKCDHNIGLEKNEDHGTGESEDAIMEDVTNGEASEPRTKTEEEGVQKDKQMEDAKLEDWCDESENPLKTEKDDGMDTSTKGGGGSDVKQDNKTTKKDVEVDGTRAVKDVDESHVTNRANDKQLDLSAAAPKDISGDPENDMLLNKEWNEMRSWVSKCFKIFTKAELVNVNVPRLKHAIACSYDDTVFWNPTFPVRLHHFASLSRRNWLSDRPIYYALVCIQEEYHHSFTLIDCIYHGVNKDDRKLQLAELFEDGREKGLIVSVLNFANLHWCCVIINFKTNELVLFDPLQMRAVYSFINKTVKTEYAPFMRGVYCNMKELQYTAFAQRDAYNCGIYVIEFIHHYMAGTLSAFQSEERDDLEEKRTGLRRLEYLSIILCRCTFPENRKRRRRGKHRRSKSIGSGIGNESEPVTLADSSEDDDVLIRKRAKRVKRLSDDDSDSTPPVSPVQPPLSSVRGQPINSEDESPPPPLVTPLTVTKYPVDGDKKMPWALLRNELVKFIHRYRHQQVTLQLVTSHFSNHLDEDNNQGFANLFETLTERVDDTYQLINFPRTYTPTSREKVRDFLTFQVGFDHLTGAEKLRLQAEKFLRERVNRQLYAKVLKEVIQEVKDSKSRTETIHGTDIGFAPSVPGRDDSSIPSAQTNVGVEQDATVDTDPRKDQAKPPKTPEAAKTPQTSAKTPEKPAKTPKKLLKESSSVKKSKTAKTPHKPTKNEGELAKNPKEPSNDNDTDTDEDSERRLLRDNLIMLLESKPGVTRAKIHASMRPYTKLSPLILDQELERVGEAKKQLFYLKPRPNRTKERAKDNVKTPPSPTSTSAKSAPSQSPKLNAASAIRLPQDAAQSSDLESLASDERFVRRRKRLAQPSVASIEAKSIPEEHTLIADVVNIRPRKGGRKGELEYEVRWEKTGDEKRNGTDWLTEAKFFDFKGFQKSFKDQIKMLKTMNDAGMTRKEFFKVNPQAKAFKDLRKNIAADGDGWCTFRGVGQALWELTGRGLVTDKMIEEFQERGLKHNANRTETKCGATWPEVLAFTRRLCSKKVGVGINLDFQEFCKNRYKGKGATVAAVAALHLEPGIYLLSGFYFDRKVGHCVVLEVHDDLIRVHDDDVIGGVEILDWLHEITFVRRVKLLEPERSTLPLSKL